MAEIRWTEESAQWLQDIYEYISADNPDAAVKVISTIYQKAQVLIEHPEIGYTYQTVSGRKVRILLYGHYRITYLIKESGDIDIVGVFHGSLDVDRYLIQVEMKSNQSPKPKLGSVVALRGSVGGGAAWLKRYVPKSE